MNVFERYLFLWVSLAILAGLLFGNLFYAFFETIAEIKIYEVNLVIAALIWVMIIPMMANVDFNRKTEYKKFINPLVVTLILNWLVKPALMFFFSFLILFIPNLFSESEWREYHAGLILLAAAPCTAMVFVWSSLCKGNKEFTLTQVAVNDIILIIAFVPIVSLLLSISNVSIPIETLILTVVVFVVIPFTIGQCIKTIDFSYWLGTRSKSIYKICNILPQISLLLIIILLFGTQADKIRTMPFLIGALSIPIVLQILTIALIGYLISIKMKIDFSLSAPSCLIAASNFFELAVATAISLFGLQSKAALATVVGVLVEVPIMLLIVYLLNYSRSFYENKILQKP